MITAIYSLSYVYGAEIMLLFWFVCAAIYLCVCFSVKANRTPKGKTNVWWGLFGTDGLIDLLWLFIYYRNGNYTNYGIGAAAGLLLWIPVLAVTAVIVTSLNEKA